MKPTLLERLGAAGITVIFALVIAIPIAVKVVHLFNTVKP